MQQATTTTQRDARGYPLNVRMNEGIAPGARNVDARRYHHGANNATAPAPDTIRDGDATDHAALYKMIAARTVPVQDREDCIQDMRAAVWRCRGTSPATVGVVANGAAIDYARKYCRVSRRGLERDAMPLEDMPEEAGAVDPWPDVDARLDGTETIHALIGAADLPTLDLQIIQWRYVDGAGYGSIAARLGMSTGAVRVRLHRTIKLLRDVAGVAA